MYNAKTINLVTAARETNAAKHNTIFITHIKLIQSYRHAIIQCTTQVIILLGVIRLSAVTRHVVHRI